MNIKHGHSDPKSPTYISWLSMKDRCFNASSSRFYERYGGRGITVCARWKNSFENFLADMGEKSPGGLTLERINNDGNYEPANCRWATRKEQGQNTSTTIRLTLDGETWSSNEWAKRFGMPGPTLRRWLERGLTIAQAREKARAGYLVKRLYEYRGRSLTVAELSRESGVPAIRIYKRIASGWSVEAAVNVKNNARGLLSGSVGAC